jgi:hypothetical protein
MRKMRALRISCARDAALVLFSDLNVFSYFESIATNPQLIFSHQTNFPMENGDNEARDPSGFLSAIIGAPVTVKLNSGVVYKGV